MLRTSRFCIIMLLVFLGTLACGQVSSKPATPRHASSTEDFASAVKRVRETWVQEFNAGHADKVAALYAEEAVMMRRNGSVHSRDSIQAELERSIATAKATTTQWKACTRSTPEISDTTPGSTTKTFHVTFPREITLSC